MTDVELTRALERGAIANADFRHVHHLRVAWVYLDEEPTFEAAFVRMRATLQQVAGAAGRLHRYSDALTLFWMHQVAAARAMMPGADCDAIFRVCPRLLDKNLVHAYSSDDGPAAGSAHS